MKKFLLLLIIHIASFNSFCQNSDLERLNNLLIKHLLKDSLRVNLLNELSFHIFKNQPEKSLLFAEEALTLSRKLAFSKGELQAENNLSVYYLMKGRAEIALESAMKAAQLGERMRSADLTADSYSILATIYHNQKSFDKALRYAKQALALNPHNVHVTSRIYNSLGSIARDNENYDSAFIYYEKALMVMNKVKNNYRLPEVLNNIGITYLRKGDIDSALDYFIKASDEARESGNRRAQILASMNLGNVLIEKNKFLAAEEIETSALTMAQEMNDKRKLMQIYLSLATIKMETGKHHEAHLFMTRHYNLKDSLLSEEKNKQITEIETRYETQKKDDTIRALEQQSEIHSLRQLFLISSLIALIIAIGIFYFLQRSHNKRVLKLLRVQKILNRKLQENDQLRSNFFSKISHEFRTPLTLILAPIESKLTSPTLQETDREPFQLVKRNANRLLTLVNQLLDLSKLEAKKMEIILQLSDLNKFLNITATSFDSLAESKEIHFKKNIQLDLLENWFDADKLEKIINNILFNAFKFTPRGGTIIYDVTQTENTRDLVISIKDTGIGIPKNEQRHVYSPFYQSRYDVDNGQPGTGLGLSLVKELVKLYNGEITLISTVNEGTSITITLPLTKERLPSSARFIDTKEIINSKSIETDDGRTELNPSLSGSGKVKEAKDHQDTILIIEDNAELRNFISSKLQDRFTIFTAIDGKEGFATAAEYIPDLIISDVMMPNMDGLMLSDKIKNDERTSHIPIILLTAKADLDSKIIGLQKGADDYMAKPFLMEELIARVTNLIEQRKKLANKYKAALATPTPQRELSLDEKFLLRAKMIVEEHISDTSFGVEQMAEKINLSRAQLFRKLKATTGISPNEFINEIRLKRAAQLILSKADTIAQIGYSVGFNEQSYFAKSFRKRFGVPPSEYSKKELAEEAQICD